MNEPRMIPIDPSNPPVRVRLRRIKNRIINGFKVATCQHDYEVLDARDEDGPGVGVYLCRKCVDGWKVT